MQSFRRFRLNRLIFCIVTSALCLASSFSFAANSCQSLYGIDSVQIRTEIEDLKKYLISQTGVQDRPDIRSKVIRLFIKTLPKSQSDRVAIVNAISGYDLDLLSAVNYGSSPESFSIDLYSALNFRNLFGVKSEVNSIFEPIIKYVETEKVENAESTESFWRPVKNGYLEDAISILKSSNGKDVSQADFLKIHRAILVSFILMPPQEQIQLLNKVYGPHSPVSSLPNLLMTRVGIAVVDLISYYRDRHEIGLLEPFLITLRDPNTNFTSEL